MSFEQLCRNCAGWAKAEKCCACEANAMMVDGRSICLDRDGSEAACKWWLDENTPLEYHGSAITEHERKES